MKIKFFISVIIFFILISQLSVAQSFNHQLFDQILSKYVRQGLVDYKSLKSEKKLDEYLKSVSKADVKSLTKDEELAFWINAYNAYTLKLIVDYYPVKSIKDIGITFIASPWDKEIAVIGGKKYTLNNIEHDIIRKKFNEPRIHFALVCAAISCPPLRSEAFTGQRLNEQLNQQVEIFFTDKSNNSLDQQKKIMTLSKILDWYKGDFEKAGNYYEIMWNYFPSKLRPTEFTKSYSVKYNDYNWSLNEQH